MSTTSRSLRTQIQRVARGREGRGRRYPIALRRAVVEHAQDRVQGGATVKAVARSLGLADQTLGYWLRSAEPAPSPAMRAVSVLPEPETSPAPPSTSTSVVVITPQGLRIEGLDLTEIASLVRSLG